jgi:hypothetical protein
MKLNRICERYSPGDCFTLIPIGDIHLGSANCDRPLLKRTIAEIRDNPNARWIGMGDYAEFITPQDKRWHARGIDRELVDVSDVGRLGDLYVGYLAELFAPIAGKCWAFGAGNHEERFATHNGTDILGRLLERLGRPEIRTDWACFTRVGFEDKHQHRNGWTIFHAHGWQSGRTEGAKVNAGKALIAEHEADIYMHGHSHGRWIHAYARLRPNHKHDDLIAQDIYVTHTGSYLRTCQLNSVSYAERAGYPPTSLGPIRLKFYPAQKDGKRLEAVQ